MANEPPAQLTAAAFLNHLIATLDASLQRWEFIDPIITEPRIGWRAVSVRFLGLGNSADITHNELTGEWRVRCADAPLADWILNRLNGLKRDEAGNAVEVVK